MRIIGYLRVSTDKQVEGLGLDVQRDSIQKFCEANGHDLVAVVADEGISGTKELENRPGLATAFAYLGEGSADAILVARLDRLARDLIVQENLLVEVRRFGGVVLSCASGESDFLADDPADPSRKFIRQILGAVNEYEKSIIGLRLRAGRALKASNGGFAYGSPGFGYVAADKELVADPAEQEILRQMLQLRAGGASYRQICDHLEANGCRTKQGGTRWYPSGVSRILERTNQ